MHEQLSHSPTHCLPWNVCFLFLRVCVCFVLLLFVFLVVFFCFICLTRSNKPNTTSQLASWCKKGSSSCSKQYVSKSKRSSTR